MHILLADDSPATTLPVMTFLQRRGYRVTYVHDGQAAVEAYRTQPPDLVLMDVVMPKLNGIEAARQIKAMGGPRWVPLILMTGLSDKEAIVAGLDAGADDYLTKPVTFEVLDARMRSMQRIAIIQDSLFSILDNVFEGIITINDVGTVCSYNRAAERIFGYSPEEVIGNNIKLLMPEPQAEQHDGHLARYLRERTPHIIGIGRKVQGRRKNGEIFPMSLAVTEVTRNRSTQFIGLVSDISQEEADRQRIEFLALHDPLTVLPNRAHFNEVLETTVRSNQAEMHGVLFIDLDGFKPINDTLGHEAGDEALRVVAKRLKQALASTDFVARIGGDEFVAIARNITGPGSALAIGNRLLTAISRPMTLAGQMKQVGASIGIAITPQHGRTANEILTAADDAMYAAKRGGKGQIVIATGAT